MRRRRVAATATGDENGATATATATASASAVPNMKATTIAIGTTGTATGTAPNANNGNAFRSLDESPRQVLTGAALCLTLAGIAYFRGGDSDGDDVSDPGASFRSASLATLLLCVSYTFLNARDGGTVTRPHRGLWRMLHGCNIWYAGMAAALLVVKAEDGAVVMGWLFPGIVRTDGRGPLEGVGTNAVHVLLDPGEEEKEGSLVGTDHLDCAITVPNLRRQIFGLWFFAHCVGWWAKMLMLRDLWTCLVYSTIFELVELTLQVLVPEFQECWWDSVILDWFVANLCIGMMLGIFTHRYLLKWPDLDWADSSQHGRRPTPGPKPKPRQQKAKVADLLTPRSWRTFDWNPDNDPVSLVLNSIIWIAMMFGEINSFFLINIFQLPRDHTFNVARQVFFCLTALPACEEWYEYTRCVRVRTTGIDVSEEYRAKYSGRKPRIGQSAWLLGVTCSLETMAIMKYGRSFDLFSRAGSFTPKYWGPWAASGALFGIYFAIHCMCFRRRKTATGAAGGTKGGPEDIKEGQGHCTCPRWLGLLKWASFVPLLFLCRNYAF